MKDYVIVIEEIVAQEFTVGANSVEEAMGIAEKEYYKGNFVVDNGEVQFRQMCVSEPDEEATEWTEF